VFDLARCVIPTVAPITVDIVERARDILDAHEGASARDALHAAACQHTGADAICSFDRDFDDIDGVRRIEPGKAPG
jgi:predicted nucleic acid-binding protein